MDASIMQNEADVQLVGGAADQAFRGEYGQWALAVAVIMDDDPFEGVMLFVIVLGVKHNAGNIVPEDLFADGRRYVLLQQLKAELLEGAVAPWNTQRAGGKGQQSGDKAAEQYRG